MAERTAEFLAAERERYEYLLACAKDAEHEELAWETIVARMTVEDFVTAAKEVLATREKLAAIQRLLHASPIGPTRAQAVATLFEIRLVATDDYDQPAAADRPPGVGS